MTNYIIKYSSDDWEWPSTFKGSGNCSQTMAYELHDDGSDKSAVEQGYETAHEYPSWLLAHCPNAPDCTISQAQLLIRDQGSADSHYKAVQE